MKPNTLKDGFGVTLTFGTGESGTDHSDIILQIDPTSVTPMGMDALDPIGTTTHSNTTYRTKHPRSLVDVTDLSFTVSYDPDAWADILAAVNDNVEIAMTYPNGDSVQFFGFIRNFQPGPLVEGELPTAECAIVVSNRDHTTGEESGPEFTAGS